MSNTRPRLALTCVLASLIAAPLAAQTPPEEPGESPEADALTSEENATLARARLARLKDVGQEDGIALDAPPAHEHDSARLFEPDMPTALAVTISGGGTLGLYESGYLYVMSEALKRAEPSRTPILFTGASAGSANALLSGLTSCLPPNDDPTQDLGWQIWMTVGFEQTFDPDAVSPASAFTQAGAEAAFESLDAIFEAGLPEDCDFVVGVPVHHYHPMYDHLTETLSIPRQTMHFVVRVQGQGEGALPTLTNYVDPWYRVSQALLPFDGRDSLERLELFEQVILASGAFPLAFAPVQLDYCVLEPLALDDPSDPSAPRCEEATHSALFTDGGVFDSIPLGLATRLAESRLRQRDDGGWSWRDPFTSPEEDARPPYPLHNLFLDPVIRSWTSREPVDTLGAPTSVLDFATTFIEGFIAAARSAELATLFADDPALLDAMSVALNRYPQASGFLGNFMGVLEEDFRRFDFYLGMYNAWSDLTRFGLAEPSAARDALTELWTHPEWQPFVCLLSWYEGRDALRGACDETSRDLKILLQVSMARVYSDCFNLTDAELATSGAQHPGCIAAQAGELPPEVFANPYPEDPASILRGEDESALDYNLRLLAAYAFEFSDLGLTRDEAGEAKAVLAKRLMGVAEALADAQPDFFQTQLLSVAGRETLGMIAYESTPHMVYLTFGTILELGVSAQLHEAAHWLRVNAALTLDGLVSLVTGDTNEFGVALYAGLEGELAFWTVPVFMPFLGVRAGYQFGNGDALLTESCTLESSRGDGRTCSQAIVQIYLAATFVEIVRAQLTLDFYPALPSFEDNVVDVQLGVGVQFSL